MRPISVRPRPVAIGLLIGLALTPISAITSAHADSAQAPKVGECYDLSDEQLAGAWVEERPVECSTPHTIQITSIQPLSADDDPRDAVDRTCGPLGVWNEVGVNRPVAGIIADPVRIEPRGFAVRTSEPTVACGASLVAWNAQSEPGVQSMNRPLDALRSRTSLRYCIDPQIRRPAGPGPTVSCTDRPRWQVRSWVVWTAFFDDYPGRSVLREQARRVCGSAARFSVPPRSAWSTGLPRTWCTVRVPE